MVSNSPGSSRRRPPSSGEDGSRAKSGGTAFTPPDDRGDAAPPPAPISLLFGRDADVAAVAEAMASARLLTLTGAPGIGKSRLALEVTAVVGPSFAHGVRWVDLGVVEAQSPVAPAVASALELDEAGGDPLERLVLHFGRTQLLLILDTCEHLLPDCSDVAGTLLAKCSRLSILSTSRQALAIPGERIWRVPPLAVPKSSDPSALADSGAVRLFLDRAAAMSALPAEDDRSRQEVTEICQRLEGVPLALELAAFRLQALSLSGLVEMLDHPLQLLVGNGTYAPPRHRALRATLDWSYETLLPQEQALLRRLCVFTGGCTLRAAEQVCVFGGLRREEVFDLLASLVAKSLLEVDDSRDTRYQPLEVVKHYTMERLVDSGEATRAHLAHVSWCTTVANQYRSLESGPGYRLIDAEYPNLRRALEWSVTDGRVHLALPLAWALIPYWQTSTRAEEGDRWFRALVELTNRQRGPLRAKSAYGAALFALVVGDVSAALPLVHEQLESAKRSDDPKDAAWWLHLLGWIFMTRDLAAAVPALEESIAAAKAADTPGLPILLAALGTAHWWRGDLVAARSVFEESLEAGDGGGRRAGWGHFGLARVAVAAGDYGAAEGWLNEALVSSLELHDRRSAALTLALLGHISRLRGMYPESRERLGEGLSHARSTRVSFAMISCLTELGWAAIDEGAVEEAASHFEEAACLVEKSGRQSDRAECLEGLGQVALFQGDFAGAREQFSEALVLARASGNARGVASSTFLLGRVAQAEGDLRRATGLEHEALRRWLEMGDRTRILDPLEGCAALAADAGRLTLALRLLSAAQSTRDSLGAVRAGPSSERDRQAARLARLREEMGADDFARAWAEGSSMPLEEAAAYALRGRDTNTKQRPFGGWESLTRIEREVANLAGRGLTNPEIGQRLFISPRTVKRHLSNVFVKLELSSRRELRRVTGQEDSQ